MKHLPKSTSAPRVGLAHGFKALIPVVLAMLIAGCVKRDSGEAQMFGKKQTIRVVLIGEPKHGGAELVEQLLGKGIDARLNEPLGEHDLALFFVSCTEGVGEAIIDRLEGYAGQTVNRAGIVLSQGQDEMDPDLLRLVHLELNILLSSMMFEEPIDVPAFEGHNPKLHKQLKKLAGTPAKPTTLKKPDREDFAAYLESSEARPGGSLQMLMEMFERMQVEAGWDVNSKLLWGYFFTNKSPAKLHAAGEDLRAKGYRLVKVFQDDEKENYWLHVEREEVHTPQSLFDRNQELAEFAAEHDLATYDGMDVGPIQVAK